MLQQKLSGMAGIQERRTSLVRLPNLIAEQGYSCCRSAAALKELLSEIGLTAATRENLFDEEDIARTLAMMAKTHASGAAAGNAAAMEVIVDITGDAVTWNVKVFAEALSELEPGLDWNKVIEKLDHPDFVVFDRRGYEIIVRAYQYATKNAKLFPINIFFRKWSNLRGQLSFLLIALLDYHSGSPITNALLAAIESQDNRKVLTADNFTAPNIKVQAAQFEMMPWCLLDLIESLVDISASLEAASAGDGAQSMQEVEALQMVKAMIDRGVKQSPELVLLGLVQTKANSSTKQNLVSMLLRPYLIGHSHSNLVLNRLWQVNPDFLVSSLMEMYNHDNTTLSRALDVAQDMKILTQVLAVKAYPFVIDLAALASRREYLNLKKWLEDRLASEGEPFLVACLDFLRQKVAAAAERQEGGTPLSVPLSIDVISIFLDVLQSAVLPAEYADQLRDVHSICLQMYPRLMNLAPGADGLSMGAETSFPADVEEEANSYYERVYNGGMTVVSMIDLLHRFKVSPVPREQDTFACMVHNLFDEYRFFEKYPEQELATTAALFGLLVQRQLITHLPLGVALRYVLDALRKPADSKMFTFGVQALRQFQGRLRDWPQYCSHLAQVTNFQLRHPDLYDVVKMALANSEGAAPASPGKKVAAMIGGGGGAVQGGAPSSVADNSASHTAASAGSGQGAGGTTTGSVIGKAEYHSGFTALNVDTLLTAAGALQFETPPEATQDKILFIVNNLAPDNLDLKLQEMRSLLSESAYGWFAHYLVVKRASIEPNYHELYLSFLDKLGIPELEKRILRVTYHNIRILLDSEKTASSSSERSLLKNLGAWVGAMTLAKNKPIKYKDIAFKELLLEGYDNNRLIVCIPFVCKVLEKAGKSRVFKPPNPWLMAIIALLVELYHSANLKLNLKFEVEVLCKSLSIDMKDVEATNLLKSRPQKDSSGQQIGGLAQDMGRINLADGTQQEAGRQAQQTQYTGLGMQSDASDGIVMPNLASCIVINPNLSIFHAQPSLKHLVLAAVDQTLRSVLAPVVERSVGIAAITARDLVLKDFAAEPDEENVRRAAHLMVRNLAGGLAVVTSKESIKHGITNSLKNLFLQSGFVEANLPQQTIGVVVNDNLDIACSIVEKAAMEKAVVEIDDALGQAYAVRRKHWERGQPYFDMTALSAARYPANMPDQLRLRRNSVSNAQMRVYEDWMRVPRQQQGQGFVAEEHARTAAVSVSRPDAQGMYYGDQAADLDSAAEATTSQVMESFMKYQAELEKQIQASPVPSFNSLPLDHVIRLLVRQIPSLAAHAFNREEAAMSMAQRAVGALYKQETDLGREVYIALIEKFCELSQNVALEVTNWFLKVDDERKLNLPVMMAIIKAQLINESQLDQPLAQVVESGGANIIEYAARLIQGLVLGEHPICTRQHFSKSIAVLTRVFQRNKSSEVLNNFMEELVKSNRNRELTEEAAALRDRFTCVFIDWVQNLNHPSSSEKSLVSFVTQLQQQAFMKNDDRQTFFFRVCIEISVDQYLKHQSIPGVPTSQAYQAIDAVARLIVLTIGHNVDSTVEGRVTAFQKITTIITLLLVNQHEVKRMQFNQKPFFRLFSSIMADLAHCQQQIGPLYFELLAVLSNTYNTLQPVFLPGFAFAWLSLISHRHFMPVLLNAENQNGAGHVHRLLMVHFRFLLPYLREAELKDTVRQLYSGTLRVLLVLLHDFPEFLADYHNSFCDVIPPSCVQLRNLILSAFPRNMRLPDPFTPNLKVDLLPEIRQPPVVMSDYTSALEKGGLKAELDVYLRTRSPVPFLLDLTNRLACSPDETNPASTGSKYDIPAINALVLYVGVYAVTQLQNKPSQTVAATAMTHSAPMDIFQQLMVDLDPEGRYYFFSAIANQLRYPNSHTHYFSCVLLCLFAEANQEIIQEQITRVLLERLIVNRPHPWGLLISFVELVKNPRYNFWAHSFTRCAPDIERLFESVARSISINVAV